PEEYYDLDGLKYRVKDLAPDRANAPPSLKILGRVMAARPTGTTHADKLEGEFNSSGTNSLPCGLSLWTARRAHPCGPSEWPTLNKSPAYCTGLLSFGVPLPGISF